MRRRVDEDGIALADIEEIDPKWPRPVLVYGDPYDYSSDNEQKKNYFAPIFFNCIIAI